jgi:ADP-heptose:LPS heptosyltransferase
MREWVRTSVTAGAGRLARALQQPSHPLDAAPRIVLVRPDHLGDVLLTTPAIAALRAALPQAYLVALVGPWATEALAHNPDLDAVETIDFPGFERGATARRSWQPWRPYTQLVREARRLGAWRLDAAVILRPDFWWGAALVAMAGVPVCVGYDLPPGNHALTHLAAYPPAPEHSARRALRLAASAARALGGSPPDEASWDPASAPLRFSFTAADRQWAGDWLARQGLAPDAAPIILHPGAGAPVKLWPAALWARTLETLADEVGAPVVVAGTPAEASLVAAVRNALHGTTPAVALVEAVSLGRYAALLARARLALGVDSGPLHLAVAVGTPSVRLYGPTDPVIFGPWGPADLHAVVGSNLPCAPCGRLDYAHAELVLHPCLRLLAPHEVLAVARRVLAAAAQRHVVAETVPMA